MPLPGKPTVPQAWVRDRRHGFTSLGFLLIRVLWYTGRLPDYGTLRALRLQYTRLEQRFTTRASQGAGLVSLSSVGGILVYNMREAVPEMR